MREVEWVFTSFRLFAYLDLVNSFKITYNIKQYIFIKRLIFLEIYYTMYNNKLD